MRPRQLATLVAVIFACCTLKAQETVFNADFQNSVAEESTTIANLNAGTNAGSWQLPVGNSVCAVRTDGGTAQGLFVDMATDGVSGYGLTALFANTVSLGPGTAVIFQTALGRANAPGTGKVYQIYGEDDSGRRSFDLQIWANSASGSFATGSLAWNNNGTYTADFLGHVSSAGDIMLLPPTGNYSAGGMSTIRVDLYASYYVVAVDTNSDGTYEWVSGQLPYNGTPAWISRIQFQGAKGAGDWFDNITVSGTTPPPPPSPAPGTLVASLQSGQVALDFPMLRDASVTYQLVTASDLLGPWTPINLPSIVQSADDRYWYVRAFAPPPLSAQFFRLQISAPEPGARMALTPALIQGVKWKPEGNMDDSATSANLETVGLSYDQAAAAIINAGVHTAVVKVSQLSILPAGTTTEQRNAQIILLLQALKRADPNFHAFLWERHWLQQSGVLGGGDDFSDDMSGVISDAISAGVDDIIEGVSPIETNLETSYDTLNDALVIAQRINLDTNGWLKNKTFMMPGAAMGAYFVGIDTAYPGFFAQMAQQVKYFSFIFKHMESQPASVCSLAALNPQWEANMTTTSSPDVDTRVNFLLTTMGLADLENFLNANKAAYPNLCNVVFWGDSSDGVILIPSLSMQAVHRILVENNGWTGYFFDMALSDITNTGPDLTKYAVTVNTTNGNTAQNSAANAVGTMTVWQEWLRWNWQTPGY